MKNLPNNSLPTPEQELLLRAALEKGPDGVASWEQWASAVEFNDIDYGSQRLLPLLYQNLLDQDVQDPLMALYKGVYRRFWLNNQFLFNRIQPVIKALDQAGIEMLFFKGAGLVLGTGMDTALRPMDDIDLLVREEEAQGAIEVIKELEWLPKVSGVSTYNPLTHAVTYHDGKRHFIDLHWHSLAHFKKSKHENEYWERSFSGSFNETPVQIMGMTDQLIHTIAHGVRWNPVSPMRWIVDALIILENSRPSIDWDQLLDQSCKLGVTNFMSSGLSYLKDKFEIHLPENLLESLDGFPITWGENWNFRLQIRKPLPVIGQFIRRISRYVAYHRGEFRFPGFLRYLQSIWQLDHLWQIPLDGAFRVWRKIKIDLFRQDPSDL